MHYSFALYLSLKKVGMCTMAGIGPSITTTCPALCGTCTTAVKTAATVRKVDVAPHLEDSKMCSSPDPPECDTFDVEICAMPGVGPSIVGSCPELCGACVSAAKSDQKTAAAAATAPPAAAASDAQSGGSNACSEQDPSECDGLVSDVCTLPEVGDSVVAMCPSLCGICGNAAEARDRKGEERPARGSPIQKDPPGEPEACAVVHLSLCSADGIGEHIRAHCPLRCTKPSTLPHERVRSGPLDSVDLLPHRLCRVDELDSDAGCKVAIFDGNSNSFWTDTYKQTWKHIPAADVVHAESKIGTAKGGGGGDHVYCNILGLGDCSVFQNVTATTAAILKSWRRAGSRESAISMRTSNGAIVPDDQIDALIKGTNADPASGSKEESVGSAGGTTFSDGVSLIARLEEWDLEHDVPESVRIAADAGGGASSDPIPPLFGVMLETAQLFGYQTSGHIYVAGADGAKTLKPHTDSYDVFVMQLAGRKNWTTCVPQGQLASSGLSDAELCMYQEASTRASSGMTMTSTEYSLADIEALGCKCSTFMMEPGDTLYMPVGTIHHATTVEWSVHFTMGLKMEGTTWADLVGEAMNTMPMDALSGVEDAMNLVSRAAYGLPFRQSLPMLKAIVSGSALSDEAKMHLATMFTKLVDVLEAGLASQFGQLSSFPTGMRKGLLALRDVDAFKLVTTFSGKVAAAYQTRKSPPVVLPTDADSKFKL